jgi:hypothetical protein
MKFQVSRTVVIVQFKNRVNLSVEILGPSYFSQCESLSSITVESNSSLTRIES